jgi:dTDP-4-amino-4,6-dideoxygalactose transaminase
MSELPYIVFGSPIIGDGEQEAMRKTLETCWLGTGPQVKEFERAVAAYTGAEYAVAVNSCTAALHLSMVVSGVGPGDEVITSPMTFAATANAITHTGATPVFVDCERDSMNIDPNLIEAAITPRTRAVMPIHFAGRPADLTRIQAICQKHDLLLIEDAAHALETTHRGRKVGSIGDLTCFSFYVTKNMTTGEGGMVTTNNKEFADKIKIYGLHGLSADAWARFSDQGYKHYEVVFPGFKYNLTDMAACIGLIQLPQVDGWLVKRAELWDEYNTAFDGLPVTLPMPPEEGSTHARHLYTLLIDDEAAVNRDQYIVEMHKRRIGTGVHYRAVHLHPYYRDKFGLKPEDFPNATYISDRTVSLPLSAKITEQDKERIVTATREITGGA